MSNLKELGAIVVGLNFKKPTYILYFHCIEEMQEMLIMSCKKNTIKNHDLPL